jgi:hypothetical protein
MQNHILKSDASFWDCQATGLKNFEIRYNDRGFQPGDTLELHRLPGEGEDVTKARPAPLLRRVTYILHGGFDFGGRALLDPSAVIMSTVPVHAAATVEKLDNMMVKHLVEILGDVRKQLDRIEDTILEDAPVTAAALRQIVEMIDEGLST